MEANEFVKNFGLDGFKVAMLCPQFKRYNYAILYSDEVDFSNDFIDKHADYMFKTSEVKRLVESHELVEKLGGINECLDIISSDENIQVVNNLRKASNQPMIDVVRLKQAIADVESCQ